jgi:hypothetical protein
VLFFLLSVNATYADVCVYKDKNGKLSFTNVGSEQEPKEGCHRVIREEGQSYTFSPEQEPPRQAIVENASNESGPSSRWTWKRDINDDGKVTISDVVGWVKWVFYYPGDWVIDKLLKQNGKAAAFLELTPDSYGGRISLIISLVGLPLVVFAWIVVIGVPLMIFGMICDETEQALKRSPFLNKKRHLPKQMVRLLEKLKVHFGLRQTRGD